ncbi:AAA family ATPase [Ferruginibacter sp.]|nr:AAA family ATPase [Ferruginibacter sp.]
MLKNLLIIISLLLTSFAFAQVETKVTAASYTKYSLTDTVLKINVSVKNQLSKLLNKKQQPPLHLLFTAADKTLNANTSRWLAAKQQQDIYRISLSAIVSKYISETEKNLEKIFSAAEVRNYILFFDEADALFGQRSAGNEKETNATLNYFLQRSITFKGTIIISCSGNDCVTQLAKQNFININTAVQ